MENIDDLMRQKFDADDPTERFEFQEDYWEQAQALLAQDEARRRRRFWLLIGLMLGVVLFSWYVVVHWFSGSLSQSEAGAGDVTTSAVKTEGATESKIAKEGIALDTDTLVGDTVGGNVMQDLKSSLSTVSENPSQSNGGSNSNPGSRGALKQNKALNTSKSEDASLRGFATNKSKQRRIDTKADNSGNYPDIFTPRSQGNGETTISKKLEEVEVLRQNQIAKGNAENAHVTGNTLSDILQRRDQLPINDHQLTSQPKPALAEERQFISILILPIPISYLVFPERTFDLRKLSAVSTGPIAALINSIEKPRFSFGLSLVGAAYQSSDSNSRWAGWAIGAYGNYRLNKNLSLMLGIQERFIPGYGASEDLTNQLRYSFGYERETLRRETRGLHSLEIPISARWHKGRWAVEAGGAAGMLFLVQNRTKRIVESSLEAPKTEIKRLVKGDTKPYNRTSFSAFVGAEYRLNNRLSVMGRSQYRFTPVFDTVTEGIKNNGLGNLDVGFRIRLF